MELDGIDHVGMASRDFRLSIFSTESEYVFSTIIDANSRVGTTRSELETSRIVRDAIDLIIFFSNHTDSLSR